MTNDSELKGSPKTIINGESLKNLNTDSKFLLIYPVPSVSDRIIVSSEKDMQKLELINMQGMSLMNQELSNSKNADISLKGINPGNYYIRVIFIDGSSTLKSIIK